QCSAVHRDLHSFPTRRSSDLQPTCEQGQFKSIQDCLVRLSRIQGDSVSEESIVLDIHVQLWASNAHIDNFWRNSRFFALTDYKTDRKSTRLNSSHVKSSYAVF